jgi:hypothetical protein
MLSICVGDLDFYYAIGEIVTYASEANLGIKYVHMTRLDTA